MIVLRTEIRSLRCQLEEREIAERQTHLAEKEVGLKALARQIKVSKTLSGNLLDSIAGRNPGAIRAEFEERYALERVKQRALAGTQKVEKEAVAELVEVLALGWETRDVVVEARSDSGEILYVRTDTGEVIDRRAATEADREPGED